MRIIFLCSLLIAILADPMWSNVRTSDYFLNGADHEGKLATEFNSTITLAAFDHYFNNFQKLAHGGNQKLTMNHFQGSEFP